MSIATIHESLGKKAPRLNELGKIKIGIKGPDTGRGFRPPRKIDHFLITTMRREGMAYNGDLMLDERLMAELVEQYGEDATKASAPGQKRVIRSLPIQFAVNEIEDILQTQWVWYVGATQLGARSDGKTVEWHVDKDNRPLQEPYSEPWTKALQDWCDKDGKRFFKLNTVLNCYIRSPSARFGGVYKFRTTSVITYDKLVGSLTSILQLTNGVLRAMPLTMELHAVKVKHAGRVETVYCPQIEFHGTDMDAIAQKAIEQQRFMLEHAKEIESTRRQYRKLLALPGYEAPAEMAEVVGEFYPDVAQTGPPASTVHLDIIDGDEPPPEPEPITRPSADAPAAPIEAEEIIGDARAGAEPDDTSHDDKYVDHIDDGDEFEAYTREQAAKEGDDLIAGQDVLDALDVGPAAPPAVEPGSKPHDAQTQAAIDYDATPKPITAKSTSDDFLHFVVASRPPMPNGRNADVLSAVGVARGRMKAWLPKPWEKLTTVEKKAVVEKVRAGKFPWGFGAGK